jgi:hypothetical protein
VEGVVGAGGVRGQDYWGGEGEGIDVMDIDDAHEGF